MPQPPVGPATNPVTPPPTRSISSVARDAADLLALPGTGFTVQLAAARGSPGFTAFRQQLGVAVEDTFVIKVRREGAGLVVDVVARFSRPARRAAPQARWPRTAISGRDAWRRCRRKSAPRPSKRLRILFKPNGVVHESHRQRTSQPFPARTAPAARRHHADLGDAPGRAIPSPNIAPRANAPGSFMNLCRSPELACEVTMQPLDRFELDAAILFGHPDHPRRHGTGPELCRRRGPALRLSAAHARRHHPGSAYPTPKANSSTCRTRCA